MASFTDSPQLLTNFNPYVQQLPVDAMREVGMYKQAKYDEGVQRIQTSIDNVAGLDVIRDVDKGYLQSKLNQLGNDLKTVAAGDFSNFQLVNSTAGMANSIAKDEAVQNAVSSTAFYKKQRAEMEKAISEGKSSQSNIYDFNKKSNEWLSSSDLTQSFNGRYNQYVDVKKKALDAIKSLHPNLREIDIPYVMDDKGNIDYNKVSAAMRNLKVEGISEGQIKQAISASLTPDDMNQLSLDANYQFRGYSQDQLKTNAIDTYDATKKFKTQELAQLIEDKKQTTDPTKLGQIAERIAEYQQELGQDGDSGTLKESYLERLSRINSDPDGVKFDIYKDGFINQYANAFKWKSESSKLVTSPLTAQNNFVAEMNYKQKSLGYDVYFKGENLKVSQMNAQTQRERNQIAIQKMTNDAMQKAIEAGGDPNAPWTPLGNPTDTVDKSYERFYQNKKTVSDDISSDNDLLLKSGLSQNGINLMLNKWQDSQGTASIPEAQKAIIARMAKNNNYLESLNTWNNNLRKSAKQEVLNDPNNKKLRNQSLAGKPSLNFNYNGTKISLTPEEIVGLQTAKVTRENYSETGMKSTTSTYDLSKLNANQQRFIRFKDKIDYNSSPQAASIKSTINKTFTSYASAVNVNLDIENQANQKYLNELSKYSNAFVPQIKAVTVDKNGKIPTSIVSNLSQLIYGTGAKGIKGDENFSTDTSRSYLSSEKLKDTKLFVEQNGKNYRVILTNPDGDDQIFQLSKADIVNNFGKSYVNNLEQDSSRLVYGNGNTNLTNDPLKAGMQKQFGDFNNIKKFQITADVKQRVDNPDSYIPGVNIKKKDGTYTYFELFPLSGEQVGYESAKNNLNMLNDELLEKSLMMRYPNYDFSNLLKK